MYENIHNVSPIDLYQLVQSLEIKDGNIVADLMCGYGAVTREILKYHKVNPILLDKSQEQLERSCDGLGERILSDMRTCPLEEESVDRAVIKMGIHEVPKTDQQTIVNQVYRILKQDGIFSLWDVMPTTEEHQILFQDIIRKKDELAGFESFMIDRYFFRLGEIQDYLKTAGFRDIEHVHKIKYRLSTGKRLDAEFKVDKTKLEEWNQYIRQRVPEHLKPILNYVDKRNTIEMTFEKGIVRARK